MSDSQLSTGLSGLDRVFKGLMSGDNLVWQIEVIEDYRRFVEPYYQHGRRRGVPVIYFRFAKHPPLIPADSGVEVCELHPEAGFESFILEIHRVIERASPGAYLIFDCLTDLAVGWYSDQMLANFFVLTCPYILDHKSLAYFAILRGSHSRHAIVPIADTTQILTDIFHRENRYYIRPLKVEHRFSPTMYTLHRMDGDQFRPVTESYTIADLMGAMPWTTYESGSTRLDVWSRTLRQAYEMVERIRRGESAAGAPDMARQLMRMIISRDERVLKMCEKYLSLRDLTRIAQRMIGTGLIGGKSTGMLLSRAILNAQNERWQDRLEPHDSFFVGSDVFYTFLVRNGCWWVRERQRDPERYLEAAGEARHRILRGTFPEYIMKSFADMLDYFGQSPIIVRSSSLLEDNFGNAFSGKYESVFCPNQEDRDKRLQDFVSVVRTVYASSMSEAALTYRHQRGILDCDEQMGLLVQRVSGSLNGDFFYPHVAGVGYSFNPYVWNRDIDPEAGMLRFVFGLGTRAVDRNDDDYTRVVALNAPELRPEANFERMRQYAQHRVDVLSFSSNRFESMDFSQVAQASPELPLELFASRDPELDQLAREGRSRTPVFPWVLTFDKLFSQTEFISDMQAMLADLQQAYEVPVDTEFSANFLPDGTYKINLLQCRPFPAKITAIKTVTPSQMRKEAVILHSRGPVIGQSRAINIDRIIYVPASSYGNMALRDQYAVARAVGKLTHATAGESRPVILLIGPGRWGTSTPQLGVPVSFAEINTVSVLCEVVAMRENLIPDVSLGTHFFNDLVEMDMLYVGVYPGHEESLVNSELLESAPNRLADLIPDLKTLENSVQVVDAKDLAGDGSVRLYANMLTQRVICCIESGPPEPPDEF